MKIAIIGAGMAGLSCADALKLHGHEITLFDKGRGPGGRMATRRIATDRGEARFDHGAQYFTVRDPDFAEAVHRWEHLGSAARWPGAGPDAWVGVPGMNGVIKEMAGRHDVRFGALVTGLERQSQHWTVRLGGEEEGPFDALIVAIPAEQAATLLSLTDFDLARVALRARSQPCWTGMFAFEERLAAPDAPIRDAGFISWAVRNSAKPGRSDLETWVVQAQPRWSQRHIEDTPEQVSAALLNMLSIVLEGELPKPFAATAHRWRFAMSTGTGDLSLWKPATRLGACGDWLAGPRVECAWLSGRSLAEKVLASENVTVG